MTKFKHEDDLSEITINTHVPSKWRFVDLETGDVWEFDKDKPRGSQFRRASWMDILDAAERVGVEFRDY